MARLVLLYGFILLFLVIPLASIAAPDGLAVWYRFDTGQSIGHDLTGGGRDAGILGSPGGENSRSGIILNGRDGLTIPSSPDLNAQNGFTVEMWVQFSSIKNTCNLIAKEGEYFLRIDPQSEGGRISFFVNAGNTLEPRVSGPIAQTGRPYHIIAVWNQTKADLWVNGHLFSENRSGEIPHQNSPVLIGAPYKWAPVGLTGVIKEVRIYDKPLSRGDVLANEYGLPSSPSGAATSRNRFEFSSGLHGWIGRRITGIHTDSQGLSFHSDGETSVLLQPHLHIATAGMRFASLQMAVSAGDSAKLLFVTNRGSFIIPFVIHPDNAMHSYVLDLDNSAGWNGTLLALALQPGNSSAKVRLKFIRIAVTPLAPPDLIIRQAYLKPVLARARRICPVLIRLENNGGNCAGASAKLKLPAGVTFSGSSHPISIRLLKYQQTVGLHWNIKATRQTHTGLQLTVSSRSGALLNTDIPVSFAPPFHQYKAKYVPLPKVVKSDLMVGTMMCPLWTQGSRQGGWQEIVPYPNREPALGWYDENSPEATDWQIKWCLEHGVSYFVYCWYRDGEGPGVKQTLGQALHQGLFHSRYGSKFKFAIMWENANAAGVSSKQDMMQNLLPYWIKLYFSRPNYLKVGGKPLLFIYDPARLMRDLGGVQNTRETIGDMRVACRKAGFTGLTVLGEYRGLDPQILQQMADIGMDYNFAYCWPISGQPSPKKVIADQEKYWKVQRQLNILPSLVTVSMGWNPSPWYPTPNRWRLPPDDFKTLCMDARKFADQSPADSLQSRMVLIDNWNEFGEGHYIEPTRQYGFGYLDAIRSVFTHAKGVHEDITPQDVGLGPYDHLFEKYLSLQEECTKKVILPGGNSPGLTAWWIFNERNSSPITYDYSGHGHGGQLINALRVTSVHRHALQCSGGCVTVPASPSLYPAKAITVEAWVWTGAAQQDNHWFINCVYGNGDTGYRMGLSGGKICWEIPKTPWSHNLTAPDPLPLNRWVYVAGTYDGTTLRLYEDGKECASLSRGGQIQPANQPLCLGNYAINHPAHFIGLLADVRLYSRALTSAQITADASR
jgi:hypothetical protein